MEPGLGIASCRRFRRRRVRLASADGKVDRNRPVARFGDVLDRQPGADEGVENFGQRVMARTSLLAIDLLLSLPHAGSK